MHRNLLILGVVALSALARAENAVPLVVPIQGRLLDAADAGLEGKVSIQFAVYDRFSDTPGEPAVAALWKQAYDVTASKGVFAAELGDPGKGTALPANLFDGSGPRFLGVAIAGGPELSPRLRLGSTPYALTAAKALNAARADVAANAEKADEAEHAKKADRATLADTATLAIDATDAAHADEATHAAEATLADSAKALTAAGRSALDSDYDARYAPFGNYQVAGNYQPAGNYQAAGSYVNLQGSTPGSAQTGHINISGTLLAGSILGNGAGITSLDASKLSTGTLPDGRLGGTYSNDIAFNGNVTFANNPFRVPSGATLPTSVPAVGSMFLSTADQALYVSNGTAWIPAAGGGSGSQAAPAASCRALAEDGVTRSGVYWLKSSTNVVYRAYCDLATNGGGWTLVMQAGTTSALTYANGAWTATTGTATVVTDPANDSDLVSPAFYTEKAEESMLCLGDLSRCAAWDHAYETPRNLANGTRAPATMLNVVPCSDFKCGPNSLPSAMRTASGGTTSGTWYRWGYVNDDNSWGTKTRIGFTGDNDASDSSDTTIGIGLECGSGCLGGSITGPAHNSGAGFYKYSLWATAPYDGPLRAFLFIRQRGKGGTLGSADNGAASCLALHTARPSLPSGVYFLKASDSTVYKAYCDMEKAGGGWTLALQASSASAFVYAHPVWTATTATAAAITDARIDQDQASRAFYDVTGTESMLCLGDLSRCASWDHASGTAKALSNGPRLGGAQGAQAVCNSFKCGPNTLPSAIRDATPGTTSGTWHRWGYVNDVNSWGSSTRVGFTGDGDSSDSSDTIIGLGLSCTSSCSGNVTGPAHGMGAGYYKYPTWSVAPHDGQFAGYLFIR